jgi:hypothetical protein
VLVDVDASEVRVCDLSGRVHGLTVNTLPPTTAADSDGERRLFGGIRTPIGFRQPWLRGMSSEIRQRRQYMIAEYVTASGALTFPISLSVI